MDGPISGWYVIDYLCITYLVYVCTFMNAVWQWVHVAIVDNFIWSKIHHLFNSNKISGVYVDMQLVSYVIKVLLNLLL